MRDRKQGEIKGTIEYRHKQLIHCNCSQTGELPDLHNLKAIEDI